MFSTSSSEYGKFYTPISPIYSKTNACGIINLGNTCYQNGILQLLFGTGRIYDAIMSFKVDPDQRVVKEV